MITCYLIGGAPVCGKTTLAKLLAAEHQAVQFSTDNIRDWMLGVCAPTDYPALFYGHGLSAKEFYENTTQLKK